ncbi:hypothetical protein [Lysinibacillus sp. Ag94]|uniref:hypothetical protein n=1 Tax=Lysinibacillus sp. Ag94 TaxID=2936682 RepID=UPI00200FFFFD|nr:hypothetical protein [Lysinibacillus sp. Ag94]UPW84054.1 hypothetical protein MY533_04020 [Lysinibacillus sp. Ag94]
MDREAKVVDRTTKIVDRVAKVVDRTTKIMDRVVKAIDSTPNIRRKRRVGTKIPSHNGIDPYFHAILVILGWAVMVE